MDLIFLLRKIFPFKKVISPSIVNVLLEGRAPRGPTTQVCSKIPQRGWEVQGGCRGVPVNDGQLPEMKILLLGAGDTGKSTFCKQLSMHYKASCPHVPQDKRSLLPVVRRNLIGAWSRIFEWASSTPNMVQIEF
eukprot:TRINITY_DN14767_c0_g1_i2.p1 TRINITY_DN14767_c0_g1~~TRINITY_DN14767_c0_g1_i2.p1  ORF type:complete len:134 (+),score=14.37 TRINITY_DN14767_c0_g1_i2:64-465(+)